MSSNDKKTLPADKQEALFDTLKTRFETNTHRHEGLAWAKIQAKLEANPEKCWSLHQMEITGGEPDVVVSITPENDKATETYTFCDCAPESPKGRRSLCYDQEALAARKQHKPKDSAINMAATMDIELLTEAQYRELQQHEACDTKTSSWVKTPDDIRKLGGALFCDRRYDTIFCYHNGAESYYAARGFRGVLEV